MKLGRPDTHTVEVGKWCKLSLKDQIFPEEWKALDELKMFCEDCIHYEDEFLLACLFSRKLNIERTRELVKKNWQWRTETNMKVLPKFADIDISLMKSQNMIPGARSKDGYSLQYAIMKRLDPAAINIDGMIQFATWYYTEGQFYQGMDLARNGVVMVQDLDGLGWKHMDLKMQKAMGKVFEKNFPVRIKCSYCVNAPSIIKILLMLIKPFVSKKLMDRVKLVKNEELIELVGKANLWEQFGGDLKGDFDEWLTALREYVEWKTAQKEVRK